MGRPWWHDEYWERRNRTKKRFRLPERKKLIWLAIALVSLIAAASDTDFRFFWNIWLLRFVAYMCDIVKYAIIIEVVLSWFVSDHRNMLMVFLNDVTGPILSPLRRVVPLIGIFDISPLIAILILSFIPSVFARILLAPRF